MQMVFYKSHSEIKDSVKQNFMFLLQTSPGEWPGRPEIGVGLRQTLFENYQGKDFIILGFPSRDFMFQEYSDEGQVKEFCNSKYGVTFPMFATSSVKGKKANSFYQNLAMITGKSPDWNFTKYLISKDGEVLKPFSKNIEPDSKEIISAIESLL